MLLRILNWFEIEYFSFKITEQKSEKLTQRWRNMVETKQNMKTIEPPRLLAVDGEKKVYGFSVEEFVGNTMEHYARRVLAVTPYKITFIRLTTQMLGLETPADEAEHLLSRMQADIGVPAYLLRDVKPFEHVGVDKAIVFCTIDPLKVDGVGLCTGLKGLSHSSYLPILVCEDNMLDRIQESIHAI